MYSAEHLHHSRIRAALPPIEVGGSVNAADVSTGFVRDALLDPSLVWRLEPPESERPRTPLLRASDSDWREIAVELMNRNICEVIDFDDIREVLGKKC